MNRLADELSPYLRQHAHNPVDWYPWGEEALARAKAEDRPILLSIGYSACHWCHVMERESFDDPDTAALMNERFVSIKVDREERPDLDQIYQLVVQLMHRSGGWPLTVFLTPDLQPYFGGTYFPPVPRHGMPDFRTVLRAAHEAFRDRRDEVRASAKDITRAIEEVTAARAEAGPVLPDAVERAARRILDRADPRHGGFGSRPKFPNTMGLEVLLRSGEEEALAHVHRSLAAMRDGGVYDQLGGGFHRYSTDERWLVPHFEKMLYDNALLLRLYADAHRASGEPRYAETIRETVGYLLREMRDADGLFYATQDADSEGEEGRFFVWTPAQLEEVLGADDAAVAAAYFGVTEAGNFEHGPASVLHVSRSVGAVAEALDRDEAEVARVLERARAALFEARERREKPFRDEKRLATWNGLVIGALAEAGAALGEPSWIEAAREGLAAAREAFFGEGSLTRVSMGGEARVDAFLEDYAHLAGAALDVHRASLDPEALTLATELVDAALDRFWDAEGHGFYFAPAADDLIVRAKDVYDNATPGGTSSMVQALLRLHASTGDARYLEPAERTLERLAGPAVKQPLGFGNLLSAIDRYLRGAVEVLVLAEPGEGDALLAAARSVYEPDLVLARRSPSEASSVVGSEAPRELADDRPTAYVCRGRTCSPPVTDPDALRELVARAR